MYIVNQWVEDIEKNFQKDQNSAFLGCEATHTLCKWLPVFGRNLSLSPSIYPEVRGNGVL
jgi:hypothetical protein